MSIFLDTGVYVAFVNKKDKDHDRALVLMKELASGKYGPGYTSDYVLDETLTVSLARTRRIDKAVNAGLLILGSKEDKIPALARLIKVDEGTIQAAWKSFRGAKTPFLSFTDHTRIDLARTYTGGVIMSFDEHFDGLLTRIH